MSEPDEDWYDSGRTTRRLPVLSGLALGALVLAGAASAWFAISFAQRTASDFRIYQGPIDDDHKDQGLEDKAEYTGDFLAQAGLPLLVATVCAAAAVLAWHSIVDRAAREWAGGLTLERWQALGGWFVPVANLIVPPKSLKELAFAHRARIAEAVIWPWAVLWGLSLLLAIFTGNAAFSDSPFYDAKSDPTPADLEKLDKYGIVVGSMLTAAALLAVVIVLSLTAAVRARSGAWDEEYEEEDA